MAVAGRDRVRRPRSRVRRPTRPRGRAAPPSHRRPRWCGSPATAAAPGAPRPAACSWAPGTPPCTRHTSVLVPPMSNETASPKPHACANAAAARTPPAGPERSRRAGCAAASDERHQPPGRRHHEHVVGERRQASEVPTTHRTQRGVRDRGDHALVLAELGRHLVRAHDLEAAGSQHRGDRAFVGRVEVGVQQAHRDGIDAVGDAVDVGHLAVERLELAAVRVEPSGDLEPQLARHERHGPIDVRRRRATVALGARSRSRRRSRGWSPARRARGGARAARSSPRSCRARGRSGTEIACTRRRRRVTGRRASTAPCAPRPSSVTRSVNVPPVSTPIRMGPTLGVAVRRPALPAARRHR